MSTSLELALKKENVFRLKGLFSTYFCSSFIFSFIKWQRHENNIKLFQTVDKSLLNHCMTNLV